VAKLYTVIGVDLVSKEGVRMAYDAKGWRIHNIRQLGEQQRKDALLLLERASAAAEYTPEDQLGDEHLLHRAEHAARRLKLRITVLHKKTIKPPI
jgi:hypothetical protein